MIKDLFAVIDDAEIAAPFLGAILSFAEAHRARLTVTALTPAPTATPAFAPLGGMWLPEMVLAADDEANVMRLKQALDGATVEVSVRGLHDDAVWLTGDLRRSTPAADLVLIGPPQTWRARWLRRRVLETLIKSAGAPVLLVPDGGLSYLSQHAVLGWKPGPEASRALHDLKRVVEPGGRIDVVTVGDEDSWPFDDQRSRMEARDHLARHGFAAEAHLKESGNDDAAALLDWAHLQGADLLAIGGFAHSRFREILLGGVTRHLIDGADRPIMISG